MALFFRQTDKPIQAITLWIDTNDLDSDFQELKDAGATIAEPIESKPWGLRQFTAQDLNGHLIHFHQDESLV